MNKEKKENTEVKVKTPKWRRRLAIFLFSIAGLIAAVALFLICTLPIRSSLASQYVARAAEYIGSENYKLASADLAKAKLLSPGLADVFLERGNLFEATENWDQAIFNFEKAFNLKGQKKEAAFLAGKLLWEKKKDNSAKIWLEKSGQGQEMLGEIALAEKNYDQARNYFETAGDDESEFFLGLLSAGYNAETAKTHFLKVTSGEKATLAKDFLNAIAQENYPLAVWGKIAEAGYAVMVENDAKKYTVDYPNSRDGWTTYGFNLLSLNKVAEAENALNKAVEIDPISAYAYQLLSQVYERQENSAKLEEAKNKAELFR